MIQSILDWLAREGGIIFAWWLLLTLAGAIAWPLSFCLLRSLPDRGYALIRTVGLVLIGYVFWLGGVLGLLVNGAGSVILAALVVLAASLMLLARDAMREWIRANWKYMLVTEGLFLALFLGWALVRAMNPALTGTEKPMEVAFTSAVQHSATFPPADPWMSGYAISYYYFGYVMAATLGSLVGVQSTVAFNLMIPTLFALVGVGVFGVLYNLLRSRFLGHRRKGALHPTPRSIAVPFALVGVVFVLLLGNFYTAFIEIPYQTGSASTGYLQFWDITQRDAPREVSVTDVSNWNYWWWFRAGRVVRDRDLSGVPVGEPIDEFPAFSFVLSDMHPHVLALPFAVLAIALALNLALGHQPDRAQIVFYAVALGALIFLNTWDGPIYMTLLVGADALRRLLVNNTGRLERADWIGLLRLGGSVVLLAVLFYLPFLVGFRSQLGGILPNVILPTRIQQFFIMFGPFVLLLGFYLAVEVWRGQDEMNWRLAGWVGVFALIGLTLALVVLGVVAWLSPGIRSTVYAIVDSAGGLVALIGPLLRTRLVGLPLAILLLGMVVVVVARLFARPAVEEDGLPYAAGTGFALLLIGAGAVLALFPDYLYLRDNFGTRMNTIFKFYYQVWLLWGLASAYAAYSILADVEWHTLPGPAVRGAFGLLLVLVLFAGLTYPVLGVYSRAVVEGGHTIDTPPPLTLDGGPSLATPDDYAALRCLQDVVGDRQVTLVEAVGSSYRADLGGRVSALTGIPTVLAWPGHESQWRGRSYAGVSGSRQPDVDRIYNDPNWEAVRDLVQQYGIDYIMVGSAEYNTYDSFGLAKFAPALTMVCQSGDTMIFQVEQ